MDAFAEILGLQGWYSWRQDASDHPITDRGTPEGTTNPELLQRKHPATVWYLLAALRRFESLTVEQVRAISFEIALLGRTGLDYASPEPKYTLEACPGEKFSGLQLMCLMHAGFSRIAPERDTGMDLRDPFLMALQMYEQVKDKPQ